MGIFFMGKNNVWLMQAGRGLRWGYATSVGYSYSLNEAPILLPNAAHILLTISRGELPATGNTSLRAVTRPAESCAYALLADGKRQFGNNTSDYLHALWRRHVFASL